ncbi:tetratricopeptide repeat protein [Nostoc sp. XA010]|uniref:tetratricopeptide repeat protein n=1 Tax=Nostoc sp. XA010 TaxID=2780407 RepID=UPI001E43CD1A|nr:CHAT domain-containing protein [Nostoc sp. XA010]MCC5660122.1 tetratricopeptide repeat protein [Nostoc sp. XA010]
MPNPNVASLLEQGHNQLDRGEYQAALQIFQQAAVLEPENPKVSYGLGLTCYRLEQYHESIEYLNKALRIKPNYILALVWRGLACQKIDPQQAQADFDRAIALIPQDSEDWQGRGIVLNELQGHEEAIASYDQALKINPNNDKAWYIRGITLSDLKRYEKAVASYDQALKIKPDNDQAWYIRGITLSDLKRYEEAVASYDQALKINPNNDKAWYIRGITLSDLKRYEEAIASYDQALKINPNNDKAWYIRGITLSDLKRYEEAIASFDQALKIKPNNDEAWYIRGIVLRVLERHEEAVASFDQTLKIKPDNDEAWYIRGITLWDLKRHEEAVASFDQTLKIKPDNDKAWYIRGITLSDLERHEEAVASFDQTLKIKPNNDKAWYIRGITLSDLERHEEAVASFDQTLKINPNNDKAWYIRGITLSDLKRYEEAVASYDQVLKIKPDNDEAWYIRGIVLWNLERYEEAVASYDQVLKIKPDNDSAWYIRGIVLWNLERYEEAVASYDQVLKIKPDNDEAWYMRGIVLSHLERYEEAVASFDQAIEFKPDFDSAWYNRGNALSNLGRYEEAVASFDQVLKIKPDDDSAWYNRGFALLNLKRYEEAVASYDQVLKIKPDNDEAWNNRGIALLNLGRYEEAVASFDQVLKIKPDNDSAWYMRGNALLNLGRHEEAVASFDQVLKIKPDFDWAWFYRGIALVYLGRYEEAVASFDQAIEFKLDFDWAWFYRGIALVYLERYEEAVASYDKAIELKPDKHEALVNKGNVLVKLKRDTEAIEFYNRALNCIDPQWWEAWNKNQGLANISALNEEAAVKISVQIPTPNDQQTTIELRLEKSKQLQYYMMQQPSLFSDLSEAKKSYEEALEFLTFDNFPEQHLQFLQELLKVYSSDNPEEFQKNLEKGTQQLEELNREPKSEQARIKLDRKLAAFNQMRVDILAQSTDPEKHIEALETAEVRKNTCLAWLREGSIYQPPTGFEFKQTEKLLNPKTAAIYWHLSPIAITTFIIKHNEPLKILQLQLPSKLQQGGYSPYFYQLQRFESWMQQWKKSYQDYCNVSNTDKKTTPWRKNMKSILETLGEILEIKRIVQDNLQDVDNLILIPHRELHLLPLDYLFKDKDFIITYLPSFQIGLQLLELPSNSENTDSQKLLNIEMHLNKLSYTIIQSAALYHLYPSYGKLPDPPLTKTNLIKALGEYEGYFHFTGHGYHILDRPRESALALADTEKLTLGDIFECQELDLRKYQLICLSACETGITSQEFSKERIIDEYVGLVSGFLAKGANNVVSTLWRVDELPTTLLIIKFYQLLKQRQTPTIALRKAKDWLRQLTYKDLAKWYRDLAKKLNEPHSRAYLKTEAEIIEDDTKKKESTEPPYAHPYYSAGFILTGKPSTTG